MPDLKLSALKGLKTFLVVTAAAVLGAVIDALTGVGVQEFVAALAKALVSKVPLVGFALAPLAKVFLLSILAAVVEAIRNVYKHLDPKPYDPGV